jgi:hypothetical protein
MQSRKALAAFCIALGSIIFIAMNVQAAQVQLSWAPPITNADGTPLRDLAGYQLYYGTASGQYDVVIDVGNQTTAAVSALADDRIYYFSVTAYDSAGNESAFAKEVSAGPWTVAAPVGRSSSGGDPRPRPSVYLREDP